MYTYIIIYIYLIYKLLFNDISTYIDNGVSMGI